MPPPGTIMWTTAARLPPLPQQAEHLVRQHHIRVLAVLAALRLLDANDILCPLDMDSSGTSRNGARYPMYGPDQSRCGSYTDCCLGSGSPLYLDAHPTSAASESPPSVLSIAVDGLSQGCKRGTLAQD